MTPNNLWNSLGVSAEELESKAEWISRDHPRFQGAMAMYFRTAGSLIRFSSYDFGLLPLALLQTIVGLEKVLKLHFKDDDAALKELLTRAVREGLIKDSSFSTTAPLRDVLKARKDAGIGTDAERFAAAIPTLRNEFFHGTYCLDPRYLPLALMVREAVDSILASEHSLDHPPPTE